MTVSTDACLGCLGGAFVAMLVKPVNDISKKSLLEDLLLTRTGLSELTEATRLRVLCEELSVFIAFIRRKHSNVTLSPLSRQIERSPRE
jgi:hypothetical protein